MPSFFSDLRRRSRASFRSDANGDSASSNGSNDGNGEQPRRKSSLQNLASHIRNPSEQGASRSNGGQPGGHYQNGNKTPPLGQGQRPPLGGTPGSRYSIAGSPQMNSSPRQVSYTSPLAPVVNSISEGSWVHQKVLLVSGTLAESPQPLDGTLIVCHHQDSFPATQWPVCDNHFKALVYLQPGPNRLRLDFLPARRSQSNNMPHSSWININFLPLNSAPPLHLVILVAKDSPMTYDAVPERIRTEGNGIDTAIRKYRMSAYLWQAFTGEGMNRQGFGRRCFRFDEEWQPGTTSSRDMSSGAFRNEAKVHVVRLDKTVAEIQDVELAQQYGEPGHAKNDLFDIAIQGCRKYFNFKDGQKQYISAMFLDSHWDKQVNTIRGHAALGGGAGGVSMAIFGSHALQSYPAHLEEVVPAFTDCTRTDTNHVADDSGESGSNWEAANIGIGAHLHETGHLFGSPHQEYGVMLRDYTRLNRTFTTREPYSTRTKSPGLRLCQTTDECVWHRLDTLRFRFHPCFALPTDPTPTQPDDGVQIWAVDNGTAMATSSSGIAWLELKQENDDDLCHAWIEYLDPVGGPASAPKQVSLTEADLRARLGAANNKNKKLKVKVFNCSGGDHEIDDFASLVSKTSRTKLPDGRPAFRGAKLGASGMDGTKHQDVLWSSAYTSTKLLTNIRIWAGFALDGMEFMYEDGETQLFGKRGGSQNDFSLDTRRGETILGLYVRAGAWVDGVQILTSLGRKSEIFGNKTGGSGYTLIPPRGYAAVGVYGSCGDWVDGFGLVISR